MFDGERSLGPADVLVEGGVITRVGRDVPAPAGAQVVAGEGRTLLPGLLDAHAHVHDAADLEQALAFGVTTVLDMFSASPARARALRTPGRPDRADLRSAGILATAPGGHGTEYGAPIPTLRAVDEAQAFVDARLAEGSDYLKIVVDDGRAYGLRVPTLGADVLRALVDAAHARSKLALVHVSDYASARVAVEGGADGLAHLFVDVPPEADFGALVARHGAFVTPTLALARALRGGEVTLAEDPAIAPYLFPDDRANLNQRFGIRARTAPGTVEAAIAQLREAGVPVLCGSDAPNPGTAHGASVHDELGLLVEAGLTPSQALAGATSLPARRFGLGDRGRVAAGLRADLVLVEGDPTATVADTRRIVAVWHGGVRFDRDAYRARAAEAARPGGARLPGDGAGLLSDFKDGSPTARFGRGWEASTEGAAEGGSTVKLAVVDGGATTRRKALVVAGEVAGGTPRWAGVLFLPARRPDSPADLSSTAGLSFFARGDGNEYAVMVFTKKRGRVPLARHFRAGATFAPVSFAWGDFGTFDGTDVTALFFGRVEPGPFRLVLDDIALR